MSSKKKVCSKCFNTIEKENYIKCDICHLYYHNICANIKSDKDYNVLINNKNILLHCDNCLVSSSDIIRCISRLSNEVNNLKLMIIELTNKVKNNNDNQQSQQSVISVNAENTNHNINSNNNAHMTYMEKDLALQQDVFNADRVAESEKISSIQTIRSESSFSHINDDEAGSQNSLNSNQMNCHNKHTHINVHAITSLAGASSGKQQQPSGVKSNTAIQKKINTIVVADDVDSLGAHSSSSSLLNTQMHDYDLPHTSNNNQGLHLPQQNINGDLSEFVTVRQKKHKKPKKPKVVYGDNDGNDLDVVTRNKWVHLSSFKSSVTENDIVSYVEKRLNISKEHLSCYKLVKKGTPSEEIKFINFKLGISPAYYNELLNPSLWQSNIRVRPFKFFPKTEPHRAVE